MGFIDIPMCILYTDSLLSGKELNNINWLWFPTSTFPPWSFGGNDKPEAISHRKIRKSSFFYGGHPGEGEDFPCLIHTHLYMCGGNKEIRFLLTIPSRICIKNQFAGGFSPGME